MKRRAFIAGAAALTAAPALRATAGPGGGSGALLGMARQIASRPYRPSRIPLSAPFAGLGYDAYRGIRPIAGRAASLAAGPGYEVDLLPPAPLFPEPVQIEIAGQDGFRVVPFSTDLFSFEPRIFGDVPRRSPGAGFSGLRLRHPLNTPGVMDEVMVVQGASYFRAVGRAMVYGLSARAVALGTGGAGPEEFPRFTHLRLHDAEDGGIRMEAVIDSPSLAGHLDMRMRPGEQMQMQIALTLLPRRAITDIGVAPLTSMYLKGPIHAAVADDFRPRVHDSDMLFMQNGAGEYLWRPITNPARIQTSAFADEGPAGFGLYQTPRRYEDFQDTEARYQDRPSALVRPSGDWGRGAVVLVEIPTGTEFMDNIVTFWRPEEPLEAGSEHRFEYQLDWTLSAPPDQGAGIRILQSRSGQEHGRPGTRRYVIDIAGPVGGLTPDISALGAAQIDGIGLFAVPENGSMRLTFLLTPQGAEAVDLRMVLRDVGGRAVGPVWLHRWTRTRGGEV